MADAFATQLAQKVGMQGIVAVRWMDSA